MAVEYVDTMHEMTTYPVPASQKIYRFFDVYGVFFAAMVVISTPLTGGYAIFTGHLKLALIIMAVGLAVGFIPHVIMAHFTQKFGVTNYIAMRRAFGVRGSNIGSIANIIQLLGWNGLCFCIAAQGADGVLQALGLPSSFAFWVVFQAVIMGVIVAYGIVGVKYMERIGATALLILGGLILYALFSGPFDWGALFAANPEPTMSYWVWIEIVIAYAFSYTAIVGDFVRYADSRKSATLGLWGGAITAGIIFFTIGALSSAATGDADPSVFIAQNMAPGLAIASAVCLLAGVITTNAVCLYSAIISSLNIFPTRGLWAGKKKYAALLGYLVVMAGLAFTPILDVYLYFVFNFIGVTFGTLFAVLIADFILYSWKARKTEGWIFDLGAAFKDNPRYWLTRGFNWRGIVTFVIGFGLNEYLFFSGHTIGGLVLFPVMVISGLIYVGFNFAFPPRELENDLPRRAEK